MLTRIALAAFVTLTIPAAADLGPCTQQGLPTGARCGTVTVPLHYGKPTDGSLSLKVIVLPARGEVTAPDPVFYLVGGPGTAATQSAGFFRDSMTLLQKTHEIVLFDLRGTGGSTGGSRELSCGLSPAVKRDVLFTFRSSEALERCAQRLESRETLRTTVFAHDIDRVRRALGAEKIHLLGVSYGTRLALEYTRLYPEHVRASALRGVSAPGVNVLAELMRGAGREFDLLAQQHPGLAESYTRLVQRLDAKPAVVSMGAEQVAIDGAAFGAVVRLLLYDPRAAQSLPAIVAATATGELGPLGQAVQGVERTVGRFRIPVLLGVLCAEDVPFWEEENPQGPFDTTLLRNNALSTCRIWAVPPTADDFRQPVVSQVPTLLLSGKHDPATPATTADAVSQGLANSLHVVTPGIGHFPTWTSCYSEIVAAFFQAGSVERLDVSCATEPK